MNEKLTNGLTKIRLPLILSVALTMMGCASGIPKIEVLQIDQEIIKSVKTNCHSDFPPATEGTIKGLWDNKRLILRQSRGCSEAAKILAEQAENRNKVIGE